MNRPKGAPRPLYGDRSPLEPPATKEPRSWGRKNVYVCDTCRKPITTLDVDGGVTPMFLACRADGTENWNTLGKCPGTMQSQMYPAEPWPERVTATIAKVVGPNGQVQREDVSITIPSVEWEWYRPRGNTDEVLHLRKAGA